MTDAETDLRSAHEAITSAARSQHAVDSRLVNGTVSRHELPSTISFTNLSQLHSAVKEANKTVAQYDFVATSGRRLLFSSKFHFVPEPAPVAVTAPDKSRKRQRDARDDQEDAVLGARKSLARGAPASIPSEELDVAQDVVTKMVTQLRGPAQELLVQSFSMLSKKLQPGDDRHRIVLALRLNAGIPVPVSQLKRCLGPCWRDGVLSTEPSVNGVCDRDLPLTEEGSASMEQGNAPLLIVTSVPTQQG